MRPLTRQKWAEKFEGIYIEQPGWYEGEMIPFNIASFTTSIGGFSTTANSSFGSVNSSGGGGGFSGGGFGGGGGGSW